MYLGKTATMAVFKPSQDGGRIALAIVAVKDFFKKSPGTFWAMVFF